MDSYTRPLYAFLSLVGVVAALVLTPIAQTVALAGDPTVLSVDSRRTYLRTNGDAPVDALKVDLAALGITPGDVIRLEELGAWDCGNPCVDNVTGMGGVFSAGATLLAANQPHRVPGAIEAGTDVNTGPTFFGGLSTNIPQDFLISDTTIQVPAGATHLFVGTLDSLYFDNSDPNGDYRLRISLVDVTAPQIVPTIAGTLGGSDWYASEVTLSWSVTDSESAVTSTSGCETTTLTADTSGTTLTCTATSAGGTASESVTVKIDRTSPSIAGTASPAANAHGWNNTDVTVTFSCADTLSGIAACADPVTLSAEGVDQSVDGTARDIAGNEASATVGGINIDTTEPAVTYAGNAGTYTVDAHIAITCEAADELSGIDSQTCADISGPASSFPLGVNTYSATAVDRAGNTRSATVTFTVVVTTASLCDLVRAYADDAGIAESLCAKLNAAAASAAAERWHAQTGQLRAFVNEVQAQSGKSFTTEEAALLIALANGL